MVELEDHSELLISEWITLTDWQLVDALAVKIDFSRVGAIEGAEQMEQRTFA
jgi:hypothetical protein